MLSLVAAVFICGFGLILSFSIGYLLLLLGSAMSAGTLLSSIVGNIPTRRLTVVIPAHNEELVIANTLNSLSEQEYPAGQFDVVVLADNCTDATAAISRSFGATVLERSNLTQRGKGYALDWGFLQLLKEPNGADAFAIVDADTWVSPGFLSAASQRISRDNGWTAPYAMQGRYGVYNTDDGWRAALMGAAFDLYNHVKPLGREVLKLSAGLKGNGMVFTRSLLERARWSGDSVTEDIDFGLDLARVHHLRVVYEPAALVLAQMPTTAGQAASQRQRWEFGRTRLVVERAVPLVAEGIRSRNLLILDAGIDLLILPMGELFALLVLWTVCVAFCAHTLWIDQYRLLFSAVVILWTSLLFYVIVGLRLAGASAAAYRALALAPVYVVWKLLSLASALVSRSRKSGAQREEWVRTSRSPITPTQLPVEGVPESRDSEGEQQR